MNRERTFRDCSDDGLSPASRAPADLDSHLAPAPGKRAEATAAMLAAAFRRIDGPRARLMRAHWRAGTSNVTTRETLMRCSDRVLADIGIAREHIPLIAKGIDPAEYQLREPAIRRWWAAARTRLDALRQARRERHRLYRELDAYSDRELEEIGLRRADIPVIARGEPVLRRAA